MQDAVKKFETYLSTEKRYSKHTVRAYIDDVQQCFKYIYKEFEIDAVQLAKAPFFRTWLSSLKEDESTAKTINRKISSLKTFYKFLLKIGEIQQSPLTHITAPKISKRLPQYVASEDIGQLLYHLEFTEDYKGVLQKTILYTFYYTGMRLSELQYLQYDAIDTYAKTLRVLGKGNKERILPMPNELSDQLKIYLQERKNIDNSSIDKILFLLENGKPCYAKYIYRVVNNNLKLVTTIDKKSPHILRHSIATHLTNNGAELNAVKELLGHDSLAATQIYTHNSIEKLKNAYKKAHPKA